MRPQRNQQDSPPSAQELFEVLAAEHAGRLAAYLHSRVSDPATVDDLFQETLLRAWQTLGRYDRSRPFGPWLRGIASNLLAKHHSRRSRLPQGLEFEALQELDLRFEQLDGGPFEEALDTLGRCLAQLPESLGKVVHLVYRSSLDLNQAAERMGIGLEAAKKRLQRGRSKLAECLKRAGVIA